MSKNSQQKTLELKDFLAADVVVYLEKRIVRPALGLRLVVLTKASTNSPLRVFRDASDPNVGGVEDHLVVGRALPLPIAVWTGVQRIIYG